MNTDSNQTLPTNSEPLYGSGPDKITNETPRCEKKNVPCPYSSDAGCAVQVCWVRAKIRKGKTE